MNKILIVDDEADLELLIRQKYRVQIRENVFQFLFAQNGKIALEILDQNADIELVLTDINMPEMDGLSLLKAISSRKYLCKTVIVSAYGDMDNIRNAMNLGAFDFVTKPINFDDLTITIDKTLQQTQQLKKTLQAIRENNILKMYVDQNVLTFMNGLESDSNLTQNETIQATVMFIDICKFTSISETEAPNKVVALLNHYFDLMVKEILAQGGTVDKFIGDAIMAVFQGEYHTDRAIEAALSIRNKIKSPEHDPGILPFKTEISIGINSGEMISGNIGSASLKRLDFTVIGDTVNTAQRLLMTAKPNQILVLETLYKQVGKSFKMENVGEFSFKNKQETYQVFEIIG
jgi:adenylate cyclase